MPGLCRAETAQLFSRILLLLPALRSRCPGHPCAALGQSCSRQPLPSPALRFGGMVSRQIPVSVFPAAPAEPGMCFILPHAAAPLSAPGLAGHPVPLVWKRFRQRDGRAEISTADSAVHGLHGARARLFLVLRGPQSAPSPGTPAGSPGPLPPPVGPSLGPSGRARGSARAPGDAGGGSQGRGALPGQPCPCAPSAP